MKYLTGQVAFAIAFGAAVYLALDAIQMDHAIGLAILAAASGLAFALRRGEGRP